MMMVATNYPYIYIYNIIINDLDIPWYWSLAMMPMVSLVLLLVPTLSLEPPMHHVEVRSGSVIDDITPVRACNIISQLAANEKGKGISSTISTNTKNHWIIHFYLYSLPPPPKKKNNFPSRLPPKQRATTKTPRGFVRRTKIEIAYVWIWW